MAALILPINSLKQQPAKPRSSMGLLAMQSSLLLIISLLVGHTFARDPLPFFYDLVKELGLTTTHATAKQRNCTYAFTHDDDTIRSNAPVWPPPQIIPKPLLHVSYLLAALHHQYIHMFLTNLLYTTVVLFYEWKHSNHYGISTTKFIS